MAIEIRQLSYAVATADTMSFLHVASSLSVKQSTFSKSIAALEHIAENLNRHCEKRSDE